MTNFSKSKSLIKFVKGSSSAVIFAFEIYHAFLVAKAYSVKSLLRVMKSYRHTEALAKNTQEKLPEIKNIEVKENVPMKKSTFLKIVAFFAFVAAALAGVAYYLKKKEEELNEYEEMLFSDDYLSDYMPKDEEECCQDGSCCTESAEEENQN